MKKNNLLSHFHVYKTTQKIRLGANKDGGYVVPKDILKHIEVCYTFGVGKDVSFEEDLNLKFGTKIYLYDHTIGIKYSIKSLLKHLSLSFQKSIISKDIKPLFKPYYSFILRLKHISYLRRLKIKNIHYLAKGICTTQENVKDCFSFETILTQQKEVSKNILLKIDIDGGEYEIIPDISKSTWHRIPILLLEIHDLDKKYNDFIHISNILKQEYTLVHIHGNNFDPPFKYQEQEIPKTMELTFIHHNYIKEQILDDTSFPIQELDYPCKKDSPEVSHKFINQYEI